MALEISFNTGSGNNFLPDSTKPLPEPKVFCGIQLRAVPQEMLSHSIRQMYSKITLWKLQPLLLSQRVDYSPAGKYAWNIENVTSKFDFCYSSHFQWNYTAMNAFDP